MVTPAMVISATKITYNLKHLLAFSFLQIVNYTLHSRVYWKAFDDKIEIK